MFEQVLGATYRLENINVYKAKIKVYTLVRSSQQNSDNMDIIDGCVCALIHAPNGRIEKTKALSEETRL